MAVEQSVDRQPVAGAHDRRGALAATLLASGVILLTMVVHYVLALDQTAPWLMGDELRYADMAKSFIDQGHLYFREQGSSFATAYPALISPAWLATDVETAYELAKAINVVLLTSAAGIVYLWARRLVPTPYAIVAAGLVLLMPTFAYTGMLMMESAALPGFLLGAFVIAQAIERPTLGWQVAVFAAIGLASLLRVQLVTLALVYVTAIVLDALFERRAGAAGIRASLSRFVPSFAVLGVGAIGYVGLKLLSGNSLTSGLGAYSEVGGAGYSIEGVARWSLWHAGELAISVGFLPAIAFGALLGVALSRGGLPTPADRAFVAVATGTTFWFVLQAAAFASRFSERIEERYMVYAAPLLLLALIVWVGRALPRSASAIVAAGVVPMLLAMTIPFERLFNVSLLADTFGLIPLMRLSQKLDGGLDDVRFALAAGLAIALLAFLALSPRIARIAFPAAVALFLALSSYSVYGAVEDQAAGARGSSGVSDPSWIDRAVGHSARVGFVFSGAVAQNPHLLYQTEFWNRAVRDVYAYGVDNDATLQGPEIALGPGGRLVPKEGTPGGGPVDEPYLLADPTLGIAGEVVAKPGPLALIRVDRPARISHSIDGVYADGWSGELAGLSQFAPLPGDSRRLRVRVSREGWGGPDVPGQVLITAAPLRPSETGHSPGKPTATRRWTVHSSQTRTFDVPVPPVPFRVEVRVTPTFSPAEFGQADARQLGAQLSFGPG